MITPSTSGAPLRSYHHGDLRAALVEAGLKALEETELDDLSLRGLARVVGVSATAVYRHFPDKRALLAALAEAVADRLGESQREAAEKAASLEEGFAALGREYVRFAVSNPAHFRLLMSHFRPVGTPGREQRVPSHLLRRQVALLTTDRPQEARRLEIQAWSVVHGLAMLMLDGVLPSDDDLIDEVIDSRTLFALGGGGAGEAT